MNKETIRIKGRLNAEVYEPGKDYPEGAFSFDLEDNSGKYWLDGKTYRKMQEPDKIDINISREEYKKHFHPMKVK